MNFLGGIDKKYLLGFSKVEGLNFKLFLKILEILKGNIENIFNIPSEKIISFGISLKIFEKIKEIFTKTDFDSEWRFLENLGIGVLTYWDDTYPFLLKNIQNPPFVLFFKGNLPEPDSFSLGLVGTRKPTVYGRKIARELGYNLGKSGFLVISGLAYGIDTEVHWGCVEANGKTIAILGCGLDYIYPPGNKKLADAIIQSGGAIISEYPPKIPPNSWNFPQRNRIIAGMSRAVIVIEAPAKSGALITAFQAIEEGREVFAVPGRIDDENSAGCNLLIKKGAKILTKIDDIFEEFNLEKENREEQIHFQSEEEKRIYKVIEKKPMFIEEIAQMTKIKPEKLVSIITLMEIEGKIENINGKYTTKNNF